MLKKSKYRAIKQTVDNITFHSKKEANRYIQLKLMEKQKLIKNLILQPTFHVIVNKKKICKYRADFIYQDEKGNQIVEDVKGYKTQVYKLKKKLVEAIYNIKITEI